MPGGHKQRVTLVTLGVTDLGRAREFYEAWGWVPEFSNDGVVFFQGNGLVIALFLAVPVVNLLTPLFAAALMVHLHKMVSAEGLKPSRSAPAAPARRRS